MADWRKIIAHLAINIEDHFDLLKYNLRERLGGRDPIQILPYRGMGTRQEIFLKGRVLENKGITPARQEDTIWDNLVNMYKRFESDEIPFARVKVRFHGLEEEVRANNEGFFDVHMKLPEPLPPTQLWHPVDLELVEPQRQGYPPVTAQGQLLVPLPGANFGVISDLDDTVLYTGATRLIHMARTVFLANARTRMPFKGVAAFYRALSRQPQKVGQGNSENSAPPINPLFYVSSSPWNIYDLISDFFDIQDIPTGPLLFLRDWGMTEEELLPTGHRSHKLNAIRKILDLFSDLPFILIGDSGQEDPDIYAEVVKLYPGRILSIYIRNVSRDLKRPQEIGDLAIEVAKASSALILADDTLPMAKHATEHGWISSDDLPEIQAEIRLDREPPDVVDPLLIRGP